MSRWHFITFVLVSFLITGFVSAEKKPDPCQANNLYKIILDRDGNLLNRPIRKIERIEMNLDDKYRMKIINNIEWYRVGNTLYNEKLHRETFYLLAPDDVILEVYAFGKNFSTAEDAMGPATLKTIKEYTESSGLKEKILEKENKLKELQRQGEDEDRLRKLVRNIELVGYLVSETNISAKFNEPITILSEADRNNWRYIADCKMEQRIRIDDILTNDCAVVRRVNDDKTLNIYITDQDRLNPKQFDQHLADAIKKFEDGEREQRRQKAEQNKSFWNRLIGH